MLSFSLGRGCLAIPFNRTIAYRYQSMVIEGCKRFVGDNRESNQRGTSMEASVKFTLSFEGETSDLHLIDFYDVSQALIGFQRSLALTTHLVLNGEIITQSPALKGANIYALPPKEGSWEIVGLVLAGAGTAAYKLGTTPKNTPLGHLIFSVYDYVLKATLGIDVDYDKSIGRLYEDRKKNVVTEFPKIDEYQLDALIEKSSSAIAEIHRPIYKTHSAQIATISGNYGDGRQLVGGILDQETYEYIYEEFLAEAAEVINGRVSSYNSNTYKGRIYVAGEGRPVPFELAENCRLDRLVQIIVASLSVNAIRDYDNRWSIVYCRVFAISSRSGRLKSYKIVEVSNTPIR
jgi:hypothetical protein